ncbi:MAG: peptidoglycan DD-metalloendopeptidase family protein [Bacillota bacterium]
MLKYFEQLIKYVKQPKEPAAIIGVALYTVLIMSIVSAASAGYMKWGIYSGSNLIAVVGDPAEARDIISQLAEEYPQGDASVTLGRIHIKKTNESGIVLSGEALRLALNDAVTSRVTGTEVQINGETLLALKSRDEAQKLLETLKAGYAAPGSTVDFVEEVKLIDTMVEKSRLMTVEAGLNLLKGGVRHTDTYEVKSGDTLWDIAAENGMTIDDLIAMNPGIDPGRLGLGDKISLSKVDPLINVQVVATLVVKEVVEPPLQEKKDSNLYIGEKKILAKGKSGKREVTYQVTYINGLETDRVVLNEVAIDKAEPKIVASGTRVLLASRGSGGGGKLSWPTVGSVISPYGKRGGRLHAGVDINAGYGAAVAAAQSGTVIRASWYSGYGKCVDISHGDGIVTRYAHLSSIAVKVGQKVGRGDFIGRVGSTGRSSGPHLHLEVLVNGHARNPMNFF